MEKKIGFIGCGNMGKAILGGLIASGQVLPGQIWVYTPSPDKVAALHDQFGINAAESAQEVAQIADIIFAAVKPGIMIKVLSEITSSLNKDSLVVSIAAGITLDQLARALGHDRKIIRAMPNTPALVNAGMTSVTPNALVTPEDTADVLNIFRCFGEAEVIAEPMIHPVVGVRPWRAMHSSTSRFVSELWVKNGILYSSSSIFINMSRSRLAVYSAWMPGM